MALDEAIFQLHLQGGGAPTLRLYGWHPPCLTIGYFQPAARDVDLERCRAEGIPVVRRPTGGRAILHEAEVTFSLVASPQPQGPISQSYEKAARALVAALAILGVAAEVAGPRGRQGNSLRTGACFDSTFGHEVTIAGRKVAGIAQARRRGAVLCQGTLLLDLDAPRLFRLLRVPPEQRQQVIRQFQGRVVSLGEALGRPLPWAEAATALARGFAQALEAELAPGALTPEEEALARRLLREKYTSPAWNLAR